MEEGKSRRRKRKRKGEKRILSSAQRTILRGEDLDGAGDAGGALGHRDGVFHRGGGEAERDVELRSDRRRDRAGA